MTTQKKNIIWIFGDQHRGQTLGIMGDPNVHTPNLDRMSTEGMYFPQACANNPWCCPARFMMMTGLYSHKGIYKTPPPAPMDPELPTIATLLKDGGYHTAYFGKWHLNGRGQAGVKKEQVRTVPKEGRGGFDTWVGYENNNSQYDCWVHGHIEDQNVPVTRLGDYETDSLTDYLLDEIDRRKDDHREQPFFAALSVQPPHVPNVAPERDMVRHTPGKVALRPNVPPVKRVEDHARRELAGYHAQIENLDWNVGRVLKRLSEHDMLDDTLIIFFSDHGDCMGSHGYREKSSPWEESVRVPFIIAGGVPYKGRPAGQRNEMVSLIDLLPTTLGLAEVEVPDWVDGYDFSGVVRNDVGADAPDSIYLQHCVRKMLKDGCDRAWRAVVTQDGWKYAVIPDAPYLMFNLNEDPYEMNNLAFNQRFIAERTQLHQRLENWIQETGDEFSLPEL